MFQLKHETIKYHDSHSGGLNQASLGLYQGQSGQQILGGVSRVRFSHLQTRKQLNSFLVIVYSGLFKNVIEALNLILEKYIAARNSTFYSEFWNGLS
jgi:hypothetical protein